MSGTTTCSKCGKPGHNVRTCGDDRDPGVDARIATLREEMDARATETKQYQNVIDMMLVRIDHNRRVIADHAIAIQQLRGRV